MAGIPGHVRPQGPEHCEFCARYHSDPRYRRIVDGTNLRPLVCVDLGEALTGQQRNDAGLSHARDWHFCLNKSKPLGPHVCACQGCGPKCAGFSPFRFPAPTIRHLLFHVYPVRGNGVWQRNVAEMLKRIKLFNGRRSVAVMTGEGLDPPEAVRDAFDGQVSDLLKIPNDPSLREVISLVPLLETIETTDPEHCFFYAHAKGVTRPSGASVHRWADILRESNLDFWPIVEERLTRFAAAGSFKKVGYWFDGDSASSWHYSGSYWWGRCDQVFSRPWRHACEQKWWGVESYPSMLFEAQEVGAVFMERYSELNLYSQDFLQNTVEPLYENWLAEQRPKQTRNEPPPIIPADAKGLNVGCGIHYQPGWVNTDLVRDENIRPDVLQPFGEPLPFPQRSFERVYCGHCIEHVQWEKVPDFLSDLIRVTKAGGWICIVAPDFVKAVERCRDQPDNPEAMKHLWDIAEDGQHHQEQKRAELGARHQWNCYEARLVAAMRNAGLNEVRAVPFTQEDLADWPVVDFGPSQCAVIGRVP